jgi:hypothetical protein
MHCQRLESDSESFEMSGVKMERKALTTRYDFEYWLAYMDDALEDFLSKLPSYVREKLDFSPRSLDFLEEWLLNKYPSIQAMLDLTQSQIVDGAARYIGETFRRAIGGHWDIRLEDPKFAFFGMPILTGSDRILAPICPLAMTTTVADRRTGVYLRTVLENMQNR